MIFTRASVANFKYIKSTMELYSQASGQVVNFDKSVMCCSNHVSLSEANSLAALLGVRIVTCHERYLGLPSFSNPNEKGLFKSIKDHIWAKLKGCNSSIFSAGGRGVLLKAVIQAIPIYNMNLFLSPKNLILELHAKKIATESSTVELSTVPCNSSIFFSGQRIKHRRFATSAALRNSSSSSSNPNRKKPIDSGVGSSKQAKLVDNAKNDVALVSSSGVRAQKRQALSFKSLFGKRSLWRRILFASTKVRSIILLNVITIIYGNFF
ncbi:hypothetical protein JRO89_XS05G0232000 [Xanthoceras sorbifolium]|uniref:Uncharacterized protein n=1 Tax=Xanthoceras sorbifolium TaxID=99658 RepID=A0ABQ8I316_9ROSI|nr:hypothetical protein JRO89_XS05G0232000 [Xanthoceras sorbifolium]